VLRRRSGREAGAQVRLVPEAAPINAKTGVRYDVMRERVTETGMALVYANWWAARMSWCSTAPRSRSTARGSGMPAPRFRETLEFVTVPMENRNGAGLQNRCRRIEVYKRFGLGVRTTSARTDFRSGSSALGRVDSALTLSMPAMPLARSGCARHEPSQFIPK